MNYTYTSLKRASETGMKLGDYQGARVYATSEARLNNESKFPNCIYCVYDDGNALVRWNEIEDDWLIVGYLDTTGRIDDRYAGRAYKFVSCKNETAAANGKMKSKNESKNSNEKGNSNENEPTIADVRLEIEVENTLKNAREMSIDSLLAGFNYGLE